MRLVSRRKLAKYAAEQILAGNDAVLEEIAGLLIYEKHEREVDLLVRDIEAELAENGEAHGGGNQLRQRTGHPEISQQNCAETVEDRRRKDL